MPKEMETQSGTVVCVFVDRGYGFIRLENGKDAYFHAAGCVSPPDIKSLKEGTEVNFTLVKDPRGQQRAIGVVAV